MRAARLGWGLTVRRLVLVIASIGALAYLFLGVPQRREPQWGTVGAYDFVAYWSAARLVACGGNPYNPAELLAVEQQAAGWPHDDVQWFWSPPWTLLLTLPFALLPFGPATMLWIMLQAVGVIIGGVLLWRYFAPEYGTRWVGLLLATGFFPLWMALTLGQISPWLLLALIAFLWAERQRQDWVAGVSLSLLMIKPHVTYLFWSAALWWAFTGGRWRVVTGWIGGLLGASGVVVLLAPQVFHNYVGAVALPPWATPTIGVWLRMLLGVERTWLQFLPSLLGGLGLLTWLWRRRGPWRWEVLTGPLLLASVVTAAYGWSYDQVVLLPAVVALVAGLWEKRPLERLALLLPLVGAQLGLVAMRLGGVLDVFAVWHAPLLGGLYWWGAGQGAAERWRDGRDPGGFS
jgi:hypothetical protein